MGGKGLSSLGEWHGDLHAHSLYAHEAYELIPVLNILETNKELKLWRNHFCFIAKHARC